MATDADKLASYLKTILAQIKATAFSFSQSSIQATRTKDENYIYEASFYPVSADPFWIGHLKRFGIDSNGNVNSSADWDAGTQSSLQSANSRNIFTYKNGAQTLFQDNTSYLTNADLGLGSTSSDNVKRAAIFTFIRGGETNTVTVGSNIVTYTNWKLGDIYHFSPVTIGVPNRYYMDQIDQSTGAPSCSDAMGTNAYAQFYCSHNNRTSAAGNRLILVGADDGQFHAFKAAEIGNGGGTELWSFIPPNFLPSLQLLAHTAHPTTLTHNYFVDGAVAAFDVWWPGNGSNTSGTSKVTADWHTLAVMNEGRGGNATNTLWSNNSSCSTGLFSKYVNTGASPYVYYPYYCGYWAMDVTNGTTMSNVNIKWLMQTQNSLTAQAHLGDPWSKMEMGRVKINGNEKWAGFIGGGYSGNDCSASTSSNPCDLRGKSFYVIDVKDGSIIATWTNSTVTTSSGKIVNTSNNNNMNYDFAATAGIIDSDNDGFIDTAYIGDTGGNVWRFKFCLAADGASCNASSWTMSKFYDSNNAKTPIYTIISTTLGDRYDPAGTWWMFFGTGDVTNPNKFNSSDKFFAVKDINRASSVVLGDLKNISTSTFNRTMTSSDNIYKGFYINLNNTDKAGDNGEKILANATIFNGALLFSTYVPKDACLLDGDAYMDIIDFNNSNYTSGGGTGISGNGMFTGNARFENVGTGVTSPPIVSYNPNLQSADVFISTSQTNSDGSLTQRIDLGTMFQFKKSKLLYWHDMRVQ
jgi:Tfp pilus tip-associated adhesin PilY1